jgi:hypothetical protein
MRNVSTINWTNRAGRRRIRRRKEGKIGNKNNIPNMNSKLMKSLNGFY